jgi:arginine-tRNA-protein transferase
MPLEDNYIIAPHQGLRGELLDYYLALGYYRMQHILFTCNETQADENSFSIPVFWLRTFVDKIRHNKSGNAIRKKCAAFTVHVLPAIVTEEVESLYTLYSNHVPFNTAISCNDYLHQVAIDDPFDSWMIEIRDQQQLIAVGYFDKGANSIAGIINIYHPAYTKFSLGKYLILKKIDYAKQHQIPIYYTGYISTAITRFDYKLFPDESAVQVFLPIEKKWLPYSFLGKELLLDYYLNHLL